MRKNLSSLAVVAGMVASSAVMADLTPYVSIHLSMDSWDDAAASYGTSAFEDAMNAQAVAGAFTQTEANEITNIVGRTGNPANSLDMSSRTSVFGLNGSSDLGGGKKMFFKLEWEVQPDEGDDTFIDRDQYIGIKLSSRGTIKLGTMSNNYRTTGMAIDRLQYTAMEARGFLNMQSAAHRGRGVNGGRSTNTVQYTTPKLGGAFMVVNRTFGNKQSAAALAAGNDSTEETTGFGLHINRKTWMAFIDYIDMVCGDGGGNGIAALGTNDFDSEAYNIATCATDGTESGVKYGGKIELGDFTLAAQLEDVSDIKTAGTSLLGTEVGKYTFMQVVYSADKNNAYILSYGAEGDVSSGFALAYLHKTGARSEVYLGYGDRSDDLVEIPGVESVANEQSVFTMGWSAKFR